MKRLPTGIEDFSEMIRDDYYYVDKTMLIKELNAGGKVTLFTRPRRFGKTLNMSMLQYFFEIGSDPKLFENLNISKDEDFCKKYQGQYPVISISLKGVNGRDFEEAFLLFCKIIYSEADRFKFLSESEKLDDLDKQNFKSLLDLGDPYIKYNNSSLAILSNSLFILSSLLYKHYGRQIVVLIDEYDVPLDKAHALRYYDDMTMLIKNMFHAVFKTNKALAFGVLTGCLRVSKESIFTGMNNLRVNSITGESINENFGFTEEEVDDILSYYHISERKKEAKEWYDGYRFGKSEVYCPWDVMNFALDISTGYKKSAEKYWADSSSNDLVREFIYTASKEVSDELEVLMHGGRIKKRIREELTYRDIDNNIDNLWSVLYLTGYLTGNNLSDGFYELWIPNKEVMIIYEDDISMWFRQYASENKEAGLIFYKSALNEAPEKMESVLLDLLFDSISIRDTYTRKEYREDFYHGFMLGLLNSFPDVQSNSESGNGYSDIQIRDKRNRTAVIMELKYSESDTEKAMENSCNDALRQIEDKKYADKFMKNHVFTKVIKYGIAFNKKQAKVKMG